MPLGGHTQLVVESAMLDLLVPVGNGTALDMIAQGENTRLGLGLTTDLGVLLAYPNHDTNPPLMPGSRINALSAS